VMLMAAISSIHLFPDGLLPLCHKAHAAVC
jgi:hypothetical protein